MKGNNSFRRTYRGVAIVPQSVTTATVDGATITEPHLLGRQIMFVLLGGAIAATVTGIICRVQGQKRSDSTWATLKENDGTTDLAFTAAKIQDGTAFELGSIIGTVPLDKKRGTGGFDGEIYKAIRLQFVAGGTGAALVAADYSISDIYAMRDDDGIDDIYAKVLP